MRTLRELTPQQRAAMIATITASVLLFSSLTSIIVALPQIQRDFRMDSSALHWVIVAALLPLCALAVVSGRLGDVVGRRLVFVVGMVVFGVGSGLCAMAPDGFFLVGARGVQGLGIALAVPLGLAILTGSFPEHRHGWVIGWQTAIISFFGVSVPLGMALLVQLGSWRWAFAAYVPLSALVVVLTVRHLAETKVPIGASMDVAGAVLIATGLTLFVFACERSSDWGFDALGTLMPLVSGIGLLALFVVVELRKANPLLDLRPLRGPAVSVPVISLALVQCATLGVGVHVTLYLQHVLDLGALDTGLLLMAASVGTVLLSPFVGRLTDRGYGALLVITGLLLVGGCLLWLAYGVSSHHSTLLVPALLVFGLAPPLVYPSATTQIMAAVPARSRGVAASLSVQGRQVGATLGLSLMNALFTTAEWRERNEFLMSSENDFSLQEQSALDTVLSREELREELLDRLPGASHDRVRSAADNAFVAALEFSLVTLGSLVLLCSLLIILMIVRGGRTKQGTGAY
ncbi:MFS transporter [Streptomyces erythrochromogenes]|uniref:MFS transporter n=1 Tax=Streptomyces erythrochromogenes TaxID=285574 RepID=UPI0036CCE729